MLATVSKPCETDFTTFRDGRLICTPSVWQCTFSKHRAARGWVAFATDAQNRITSMNNKLMVRAVSPTQAKAWLQRAAHSCFLTPITLCASESLSCRAPGRIAINPMVAHQRQPDGYQVVEGSIFKTIYASLLFRLSRVQWIFSAIVLWYHRILPAHHANWLEIYLAQVHD